MHYYSSSFAIQVFQLIYAKIAENDDPQRAREFKDCARRLALDLVHYPDHEERAIPYGYGLSVCSSVILGSLAYADVELPAPLTWAVVKGIVLRNLRWWQTQHGMWTSSGYP